MWAKADNPQRVIAALELLASVLCVIAFGDAWSGAEAGEVQISGWTDNRGNQGAARRRASTRFPLMVVLAEMAEQLRKRNLGLDLRWTARHLNQAADALSNGDTAGFDPEREVKLVGEELPWVVLPKLMEASAALYAQTQENRKRPALAAAGAERARRRRRLQGRSKLEW